MERVDFDAKKFARRLKELRGLHNLSQMALAEKTGLSQSAITKWEVCRTEPTASSIVALACFFDEKIEYVLGITD